MRVDRILAMMKLRGMLGCIGESQRAKPHPPATPEQIVYALAAMDAQARGRERAHVEALTQWELGGPVPPRAALMWCVDDCGRSLRGAALLGLDGDAVAGFLALQEKAVKALTSTSAAEAFR